MRTADIKVFGKILNRKIFRQMLVNVRQNFMYLPMVGGRIRNRNILWNTLPNKNTIQKCHQFQKNSVVQNVLTEFFGITQLVNII